MITINKKLFLLGLIAPIPLFLIPDFPFIYINIINEDLSWIQKGIPPYTGYTASLGLAAPLILFSAFLTFILFILNKSDSYQKEFFQALILILIFSSITLFLSNSIKVFGPISSFIGFFMTCFIFASKHWRNYSNGFLLGISIFSILHAISIILFGFNFSKNSEGISIFKIEIYQALVSYAGFISFFFGTLVLNHRIFKDLPFLKNKIIYERMFYLIVLFSSLLIISMTSRRLSILVCLLACLMFFINLLINGELYKKWKSIIFLLAIIILCFVVVSNFYSEYKSLSYENMIEPRLSAYIERINFIFDSSSNQLIFGTLDGWAQIENGIIDIILNTGLFGLLTFAIIFIHASYLLNKIALMDVKWNSKSIIYLVFSVLVLFLNNVVNNGISTPYFFICFMILLTIALKSHQNKSY
jgi:hypothetical protein